MAKCYHYNQGWAIHSHSKGDRSPRIRGRKRRQGARARVVRSYGCLRRSGAERMDRPAPGHTHGCRPGLQRGTVRWHLSAQGHTAHCQAAQQGWRFRKYSDALNPAAGRTQYVGSPKSDYRARLYEKGWEQVGKVIDQPARQRAAVRVHPQHSHRRDRQAAGLDTARATGQASSGGCAAVRRDAHGGSGMGMHFDGRGKWHRRRWRLT